MVLTQSTMMKLGTSAPDFDLEDVVEGKKYSLSSFAGKKALLVMFICSHCPYVKHIERELSELGNKYMEKGVGVVAISSNDPNYDYDDRPEGLKEQAEKVGFKFPYLYDETQEVAKSYTAACTPDFFLFDEGNKLVYRGQLDDSRPENGKPVTGEDLTNALDAVLAGKEVSSDQKPSAGCNVKWKQGNEPEYY
jgi:peroxiredoxin